MFGPIIRSLVALFVMAAITIAGSTAQEKQSAKAGDAPSNSPSGADLYIRHCAVCHAQDLKGAGPFPPPYRTPPDLTTLARRHGGKFPAAYVSNVLNNGVKLPAHGPAEMPVWGSNFAAKENLDGTQVAVRIKNLTSYIKSLQEK